MKIIELLGLQERKAKDEPQSSAYERGNSGGGVGLGKDGDSEFSFEYIGRRCFDPPCASEVQRGGLSGESEVFKQQRKPWEWMKLPSGEIPCS